MRTGRVEIIQTARGSSNSLSLKVDRKGNWFGDRSELSSVKRCLDIDLSVSPATNTLPIRRLNLSMGESREIAAAWVRFPELSVQPLRQRYTRMDALRYRYESVVSGFLVELEVDDLGLVTQYSGLWKRETYDE